MATETKTNGAGAVAVASNGAAATHADAPVGGGGISTDQLARAIASDKKDNEADAGAAATAGNEGQAEAAATAAHETPADAGGETKVFQDGLAALKLSPEQAAAIEAVVTKGEGELDPNKLGLSAEQTEGLQKLLNDIDTTAEPAAAANDPADEALDLTQVPKLTPEQGKHVGELFKTRLGKVIATERGKAEAAVKTERDARAQAESQVQTLQQQLQQAKTTAAPVNAEPMADVTTAAQLATATHNAQSVKSWAQQNLRLVTRRPEVVEAALKAAGVKLEEYSADAMEDYLFVAQQRAENTLAVAIPQRKEYLTQEATFNAQAARAFPQLADTKSEFYADAMGVLATIPEIRRLPHWQIAAAVYAKGLAVVKAEQAAALKVTPKIKLTPRTTPPKVSVRPGGAGRATDPADAANATAEKRFKTDGSTAGLAQMFGARRRA